MINFESLKEKLEKNEQGHLLRFWNELNDIERGQLITDIQELNLEEIQSFFRRATASLQDTSEKLDDRLQPVPESKFMSISRCTVDQLQEYNDEGKFYYVDFTLVDADD